MSCSQRQLFWTTWRFLKTRGFFIIKIVEPKPAGIFTELGLCGVFTRESSYSVTHKQMVQDTCKRQDVYEFCSQRTKDFRRLKLATYRNLQCFFNFT